MRPVAKSLVTFCSLAPRTYITWRSLRTYDPTTKRVFVFNAKTKNATVLDANNGQVAGTVTLSGAPEQAQLDGRGSVFVNIDDKSSMVQFDAKTLAIKSEWPLAPCEGPSALAFDSATGASSLLATR